MKFNKQLNFVKGLLRNKIRFSEFALTNTCSAQCSFCTIWQQKPKVSVNIDKALKTIDKLADLHVKFITLTGGEPVIHPHVEDIVQRCTDRGIISSILVADPRLLTENKLNSIADAGIDMIAISLDHYEDSVLYESRKIEGLTSKIENAVSRINAKGGIDSMASILISTFNHTSLEKLLERSKEMGFKSIAINYPEFSQSPVYTLGGEGINLTKQEVATALEEVIRLQKKGYNIVNPELSMKSIISYLIGKGSKYKCFGGYRVLFVDWFFHVHPCMHLADNYGDILDMKENDLRKKGCDACNMSWYRDMSIYFNGIKSIRPILGLFGVLKKFI
jgi:MoaA/NifB/PqqE/SkfB family radical SAM enzyme